jgi:hypothetical protein
METSLEMAWVSNIPHAVDIAQNHCDVMNHTALQTHRGKAGSPAPQLKTFHIKHAPLPHKSNSLPET